MKVSTIPLEGEQTGYIRVEQGVGVGVDLWPSAFNLNGGGQAACREVLERYARRFFDARRRRRSSSLFFGAGPTFIHISRLEPNDRHSCLDELLDLILENLEPLRWEK